MGIVSGIVLIILGALCVPALVAQKSPKAKELIDKVVPYQGIFGIIIFIWGIWGIISAILNLGWLALAPIWWVTYLVGNVVSFLGGAILGWSLIQKYLLSRAPENVKAKAEESFAKIVAVQPTIGIAAIIIGLWVIICGIVWGV
jgi:hypothetical protein